MPLWNGRPSLWADKDNALVYDSQYASGVGNPSIYIMINAGTGYAVAPSATEAVQQGAITVDNGAPITYANLITKLQLQANVTAGAGQTFNKSSLQLSGFDFSSIPPNSIINSVEYRVFYKLVGSTLSINYGEVRVNYDPAPQTIAPTSISSTEAFDQPSFSPGITYVDLDSAPSTEAHAEPRLNMQLRPSSVSSAEAFGMLTTKLVFGLEGIPSAESVSPVSFTTQFITAAGDIPSEEGFGTLLKTMFMSAFGNIAPEAAVEAPSIIQSAPPPPPPTDWSAVGKQDEKYYLYKISKHDGTYVGVWVDVADNLEFTERINSPGTTTTVRLARSANTTREVRANLLTQGGDFLTTEDGARLVSVYETPNTVGEGTDVELNYNVDIYVHYGEFARLVTQLGEPIVTQAGDNIMVVSGAPLGTRVFSGYVLDYDASYGEESSVWVTVVSHGNELSDQEVLDGTKTNVRFSGTELSVITKNILDTNPGRMSYSSVSLPSTGVTQTMDFQLNTKLEAIQSIYDQTPDGWYWYGDVAENLIYMRPVSQGYDHTFVVGWHIKTVRIKRTMEGLKNRVYFVGGQTDPNNPATTKFKKYENPTSQSQWRVGLERITDRRYTLDASMLARGNKVLSAGAAPVYTTTVTITSGRYDIESIKIGQTVGFKNFGNYIDGVPPLQIVSKTYTPTAVTLELGALLDRQVDTLSKTEKALNNEQYQNLPNTPS
ncbi:hypothetical protein G6024_14675 [Dietzia maris]|nr:hypothetical protein [Dietzia maris]